MAQLAPLVAEGDWAALQQVIDDIYNRFPLGSQDIANAAITPAQIAQAVFLVNGSVTLANGGAGTETKISVGAPGVLIDTMAWWDLANKKWVPKQAGWYLFAVGWSSSVTLASGAFVDLGVYKNAGAIPGFSTMRLESANSAAGVQGQGVFLASSNGSTDYFELFGNCTAAAHTGTAAIGGFFLG